MKSSAQWVSDRWHYAAAVLGILVCCFALSYFGIQVGHSNHNANGAKVIAQQSQAASVAIQRSLVAACEGSKLKGGMRYIEAQDKRHDIKRVRHDIRLSHKFNYSKIFPTLSHHKVQELIRQQNVRNVDEIQKDQATIDSLIKYNCPGHYPLPTQPRA